MNHPKANELDYINFLVATPKAYSCLEAGRVQPDRADAPAHDALTRVLHRLDPDPSQVWDEANQHVTLTDGLLILDDTTLDKPYARQIGLVRRHWSGKHHRVVAGINLVTLLWSDGDAAIPCDYRLLDKPTDGQTKNDHFQAMLTTARTRGFAPKLVAFDSWYSSLANLKLIRSFGWRWLTQLKANRQVDPDRTGNRAVSDQPIAPHGSIVHLKGYGLIKVFRIVTPDGDTEHWATNDLDMGFAERDDWAGKVWTIETYHRGLKQFCGVERAQVRAARAQRNHIGLAIRAFLRLEHQRLLTGTSWFETKMEIIRHAVRAYLAHPCHILAPTA
jgi:putative transposase